MIPTSRLPATSTCCPGPWPWTSADGEYTRRYSAGSTKRSPESNTTSSVRDFLWRVMSVGLGVAIPTILSVHGIVGLMPVNHAWMHLMHAAEARPRKIDPRRLAGDVEQHLRVRFIEAHGGNLVPAEERWFAQPLGVGGDFLQGEAVVLDPERAADVAHLVLVLGIHVHAHHGGVLGRGAHYLGDVVQREVARQARVDVADRQRLFDEDVVAVRRLDLADVRQPQRIQAIEADLVADHPHQQPLLAHAGEITTEAAVLEIAAPYAHQFTALQGAPQLGARAGGLEFQNLAHDVILAGPGRDCPDAGLTGYSGRDLRSKPGL